MLWPHSLKFSFVYDPLKEENTKNTKNKSPHTCLHSSTCTPIVTQGNTPDSWLGSLWCRHRVFPQTCLLFYHSHDWEEKADTIFSCQPLSNLSL